MAAPVFAPAGGNYTAAQSVSISSSTSGAAIRYTTDGSTPSATVGTLYSGPVAVSGTTTLKAIAYASGLTNSGVATAVYNILTATPTFSPAGGNYATPQTVTLSSTTAGAAIRYTTDGNSPSDTVGTVYSGPVTVSATTTLKAIAYASGLTNSGVATAVYNILTATPAFSPAGGNYATAQTVTITTATAGAAIRYTTDGTVPTATMGTVYSVPVTVSATTTLKAVAYASGLTNSGVATAVYNILTATPTFSPAGGNYVTAQTVAISTATAGAAIRYTTDGTMPTATMGTVYSGPVTVSATTTLKAVAYASGLTNSGVATAVYNIVAAAPIITGISPASGAVGTPVTIAGSNFGASQGSGTVAFNGIIAGTAPTWGPNSILVTVPSGATTGNVVVTAGGMASNGVSFTVTATDVTLSPNIINMVVGEARTIQALSPAGQTVKGLTWTSSDPTVVSLSTEDPPMLTALAAGQHVKITAGTAVVDVTVSPGALPLGTVIWSNPGNGSGVTKIVPAVPSPSGVADVFAFQGDGTVQAITSDGTRAWTADVSHANQVLPDFQGGLIVQKHDDSTGTDTIVKLDGISGQPYPAYTGGGVLGVYTDGTVFLVQRGTVVGIDPTTGTQKFSVPLGASLPDDAWGNITQPRPIVAGDGYAYVPYIYRSNSGFCQTGVESLAMVRISSSGAYNDINILDWPTGSCEWDWLNAYIITNADTGVLLTWDGMSYYQNEPAFGMVNVTGTSVSLVNAPQVPGQYGSVVPVLQAQDGSFVGTVATESTPYLIAFDATGNARWTVPGDYQPQIATADGGVIAQAWDPVTLDYTGPVVTFDQNGNVTGQSNVPTYSWFGNSYHLGSVEQISASLLNFADSFWAFAQGNASGNGTANRPLAKTVQQLIAQSALGYVGSLNWVGLGHPACNQFVQKVLEDAGQQVPYSTNWRRRLADYFGLLHGALYYPALAGDWASHTKVLGCWHNVTFNGPPRLGADLLPADLSKPGDIIAEAINYINASGHVGIVVGAQQTVSADSAAACFPPYSPTETIDISDYGFRPDNWVDPYSDPQTGLPCRTSGKKSSAVVKRFVCQ